MQFEQFKEHYASRWSASRGAAPLSIKVLVNFAPQNFEAAALRPLDTVALVSILRRISREPQFGKFSVVAFNIQEQRVLYRQTSEDKIDFPALGEAIHSIKLGTVDLKRLSQKHGDTEFFLADLIKTEMSARIIRTPWCSPARKSCWMNPCRKRLSSRLRRTSTIRCST